MNAPELDGLLKAKISNIEAFRDNQDNLWFTINTAYIASHTLLTMTVTATELPPAPYRTAGMFPAMRVRLASFFPRVSRGVAATVISFLMHPLSTRRGALAQRCPSEV